MSNLSDQTLRRRTIAGAVKTRAERVRYANEPEEELRREVREVSENEARASRQLTVHTHCVDVARQQAAEREAQIASEVDAYHAAFRLWRHW